MKDTHGTAIEGSEIEQTVSNSQPVPSESSCTSFRIPFCEGN